MMDWEEARELARSMLSEKRYLHSLAVSKACGELAPRFGADPGAARLAGMLHDILKEQDDAVLLKWMGGSVIIGETDLTGLRPVWHGWAAAGYMEQVLGLPRELADAVRHHTAGKAGMTPLEKTVFLADYISEDRTFDGSAEVRETAARDPEAACLQALQNIICHVVATGRRLDVSSVGAYNHMVNELSSRKA